MSGYDLTETWQSSISRFFGFQKRGLQHHQQGSNRDPQWVIFNALTHPSSFVSYYLIIQCLVVFIKNVKEKKVVHSLNLSWNVCYLQVASVVWVQLISRLRDWFQGLGCLCCRWNVWSFWLKIPKLYNTCLTEWIGRNLLITHTKTHAHVLLWRTVLL